MAPWCILCIILCSTSCHYDVYSAVRHATMMYTLHYTLQSVLVPWCILCIILCIPSCHHHECSVCILLPWWMQSKHVHSALISYSEPASLQDKCRVCKLCLILCQNLWSLPPLHFQYSAQILEWFSIRKIWKNLEKFENILEKFEKLKKIGKILEPIKVRGYIRYALYI